MCRKSTPSSPFKVHTISYNIEAHVYYGAFEYKICRQYFFTIIYILFYLTSFTRCVQLKYATIRNDANIHGFGRRSEIPIDLNSEIKS